MDNHTYAFCRNSRRWLIFMDMIGRYPSTCANQVAHQAECDNCTYLEEREPTKYLLEQLRILHGFYGWKQFDRVKVGGKTPIKSLQEKTA